MDIRDIRKIMESKPKTKQQLIKGSNLKINDIVEIMKSTRGQQSEVKIIGVTNDNLAIMQKNNGSVIKRITRNIKIQK